MTLSVLLIMKDPIAARSIIDRVTRSGDFTVEWHQQGAEAAEVSSRTGEGLQIGAMSAVLLDLDSISSCGTQVLEQLFSLFSAVPLLLLTNRVDSATVSAVTRAADETQQSQEGGHELAKLLTRVISNSTARDELRDERARSNVILDSIGDGVLSCDMGGRVSYLNSAAEKLTGWSREEALRSPVEQVLHIVDVGTRQRLPNQLEISIRQNKVTTLPPDSILIRRDGDEAYIEDSTSPIRAHGGEVTGAVMTFRDVTEARTVSARMSYLAHHDSLTDLPNRLLLRERLNEAIAMAKRHDRSLALIYFDLDRFKYINDSLGHSAGDHLLQFLAQRLRACVRDSDTVSRTGGDEFAVLLPEIAHPRDAAVTARKMLDAARKEFVIAGLDVMVTGSAGIATYPDDGLDENSLCKSADIALYHSKDSGRDRYQFFSSDMNARVVQRQTLETELRVAADGRQFVLHYQPKIALETGKLAGIEALIRWHHPRRGLVLPTEFIGLAEDTAIIIPIGRWVVTEACRQMQAWRREGHAASHVAVNVSAVELRSNGFVDGLRSTLAETGLDPSYLELELTETFLLQDYRATASILGRVKDMGVTIALDDFGTGYSSLSYLRRFPVDSLKIDQSFIHHISNSPQDASIVEAIISLGHNLGLRVVAEGVETTDQLAFLRHRDCPEAQGFYFSPAVSANDVVGFQASSFMRALDS